MRTQWRHRPPYTSRISIRDFNVLWYILQDQVLLYVGNEFLDQIVRIHRLNSGIFELVWHNVLFLLSSNKLQHEKTFIQTGAPNEDSNLHAHSCNLIRVFVVHMKNCCIPGYPKCAQGRFWSDCANAQADLNLRWAHMSKGTFTDDAA